jgi:ribonuclease D
MALQYKFFTIPVKMPDDAEAELNRFMRSARVITAHREFVAQGENSFCCVTVEYLSDRGTGENTAGGKSRTDYKEVLSPENFALYAKLREWRKEVSSKEAIPAYAVFTNEQLAKIAEKRAASKSKLQKIEGIGEARIEKYGEAVIKIVQEFNSGTQKTEDEPDSRPDTETGTGKEEQKNETKKQPVLFNSNPGKSLSGLPQSRQR